MLCSECSAVVDPVVAVDIDGTLGDYHSHFIEFAAGYLGQNAERMLEPELTYHGDQPFREWFENVTGKPPHVFREIKLAYRQGGMKRTMPAYPAASTLLQVLREAGAEVHLTTTRPYMRLDNVDPDTRAWLSRHGMLYDGLLYDEDKYKVLARNIDPRRVVAVIDDQADQYIAAAQAFGDDVPLCVGTVYNMHNGAPKTDSLQRAGETILQRIKEWSI